jgi:tRNA U34 5-carboxymethylaminomethyl modifying GTPase MnmE/TrmE
MRWDPDKYEILKGKRVIKISALKGYNFDIFLKEVEERIKKLTGEVFFSISLYEKSLLREIFEFLEKSQDNIEQDELSALYLKMALNRLSKLLGKDTDEELLRNIFKNFCVGK